MTLPLAWSRMAWCSPQSRKNGSTTSNTASGPFRSRPGSCPSTPVDYCLARPASTLSTSITSPIRSIRAGCWAAGGTAPPSPCRWSPAAADRRTSGSRCLGPAVSLVDRQRPRQLSGGAPHHLRGPIPGRRAGRAIPLALRAAPPGPCRQRVPRLAVRACRHADSRRPGREGDDRLRRRRRQPSWNGSARSTCPIRLACSTSG